MNSSGKVLTIFLIIIGILLISLTAISTFFFQKEIEKRKNIEVLAQKSMEHEKKLEADIEELKKQNFVLQEKNKEADKRINSLLDEQELQEGIREELKKETEALKEQVAKAEQDKEETRRKLAKDLMDAEQRISDVEAELRKENERTSEIDRALKELEKKNIELTKSLDQERQKARGISPQGNEGTSDKTSSAQSETANIVKETSGGVINNARKAGGANTAANKSSTDVELEPIVVNPSEPWGISSKEKEESEKDLAIPPPKEQDGRILSVDTDTEFVIINLGSKDGINVGQVLGVYRGEEYLGDIKISRTQPEMSAADFVLPFSSKIVRKNDQVITK